MNLSETDQLLTLISNVDNRNIDDATVLVWHEILGDLPYAECVAAMKAHFRENTEYLTPAFIRARARMLREDRSRGTAVAAIKAADPVRDLTPEQRSARLQARIEACMEAARPGIERLAEKGWAGEIRETDPKLRLAKLRAREERRRRERSKNPNLAGLMSQATRHIQPGGQP